MGRMIADAAGRGWFDAPGVAGDRTLAQQMVGLDHLVQAAPGRTVLDLGCAEGLIGLVLMRAGAVALDGIDLVHNRIVAAGRNAEAAGVEARYWCQDLDGFADWAPEDLAPRYDLVLALSIAHKLARPDRFLEAAAARCDGLLAVRLPAPVIQDRRSGFVPVDVPALLDRAGFDLEATPAGSLGEWIGLFRRRQGAERPCA
ncbi:methyltransferase domain-containing protein [Inquilinus sp. CA228]|uniref:methyltransferase domain-containing protein n=1 Tax=Inquilinus sp. CA228 TaxID=3455609 RepID=UPI003F8D3192